MGPILWTAIAIVAASALVLARFRWRNWGATPAEIAQALPGDEFVPDPAGLTTRAVTVDAPADEVWRWLVQIGQDRGGMYSYDWLENLLGLDIHSATEIHPEWELREGDRVVLVKPGWMGLKKGYSLPVDLIDPGRVIVLRQSPPEHPWNAVWSFHVIPQGETRCRLISRGRDAINPGIGATVGRLFSQLLDPITMLMTRKMLLTIKSRAEQLPILTTSIKQESAV
jgi:hypothetical protein